MNNLTALAFPFIEPSNHENGSISTGFTKHEIGAFIIAQGLVSKYKLKTPADQIIIAQLSKELAAEILNQF